MTTRSYIITFHDDVPSDDIERIVQTLANIPEIKSVQPCSEDDFYEDEEDSEEVVSSNSMKDSTDVIEVPQVQISEPEPIGIPAKVPSQFIYTFRRDHTVYELYDVETNHVQHISVTNDTVDKRIRTHVAEALRNKDLYDWIRSISDRGENDRIGVKELFIASSRRDANNWKEGYIREVFNSGRMRLADDGKLSASRMLGTLAIQRLGK